MGATWWGGQDPASPRPLPFSCECERGALLGVVALVLRALGWGPQEKRLLHLRLGMHTPPAHDHPPAQGSWYQDQVDRATGGEGGDEGGCATLVPGAHWESSQGPLPSPPSAPRSQGQSVTSVTLHIWCCPQAVVLRGDKIGKGQVGAGSQLQGQWVLFHLPT